MNSRCKKNIHKATKVVPKGIGIAGHFLSWLFLLLSIFSTVLINPPISEAVTGSTILTVEAATKLVITSTAQTVVAGGVSSVVTVQAQHANGNMDTGFNGTVNLASTSGTMKFDTSAAGAFNGTVTSITLTSGTGSFYFKDTTAGTPTITVSSTGLTSASQVETINAGAATKLAITSTAQTVTAGVASSAVSVQAQDAYGNLASSSAVVSLSSTAGTMKFDTSATGLFNGTVTSITLSGGSGNFYFKDTTAGSPTITVSSTGLTSASQVETITAASATALFITSTAQSVVAGVASSAVSVEARDTYGNVATGFSGVVNFSSTAGTMRFDTSATGLFNGTITSITLSGGTGSFYFKDTTAGSPGITVSSTGLTSASQTETITAGVATKLAITSTAQTVTAGVASAAVVVQAQDTYGNLAASSAVVNLSSTSATMKFDTSATGLFNGTITSITLSGGSGSFYFKNTTAGSPTITVSDAAGVLTSGSQTETITPGPLSYYVVTTTTPQVAGTGWTETVTAKDQYGNTATGDTSTVVLSGTGSLLFYTNGTYSTTTTTATLSSGTATLYLKDNVAETVSYTVTRQNGTETATSGSITILPASPTNLRASDWAGDGGNAISLSWTPSTAGGVTEQRVYRSTTVGGPYTRVAVLSNNTASSHVDTGLVTGSTYYYVVRAYATIGESANSNEASAVPANDPPFAPTNLVAKDRAGDSGAAIALSWTSSASSDVTEQRVYRSTTSGGSYSLIATISSNTTSSYSDTGLTNGTTYYYVIRAYDGVNESASSNESNAAPANDAPFAPTGLSGKDRVGDAGGAIDLSWTVSTSGDVTQQRVYRSTTSGSGYTLVTTISNNTTNSYTDTGLTNGTTYYYVIRAYDSVNESANSTEANAAPANDAPYAPTDLTVADRAGDAGGAVNLSWTVSTSSDVTEQRVYRSTTSGSGYALVATISNNTTNSYTDTGLTNGTTYYYVVWAFDGVNESANSTEANAVPVNDPPFAPTGLSAVDTPADQGGSLNLSWTVSTSGDVTQQRIYRSTTSGSGYTLVATISNNTTTSYTDTGLTNGTIYYYVVRAYDGVNESASSTEANAVPIDNTAPAAPTGLSAADTLEGGSINLSWTVSTSGDVKEQRIYRSTTTGGPYTWVATIGSTVTSFRDTGLTNGTRYYYVVRAYDGTNESTNSNEASAIPSNNTAPAAPTGLIAADRTGDAGGAINLSWTVSTSSDVTEQRVYRSTTSGSGYALVATISNNTTNSYTDTGLTNGTTYYYVVRAFDGVNESANSTEANAVTVNDPPFAPIGLTAADRTGDAGGAINLSWTVSTSSDVTQQRIYRSTTSGSGYTLVATISNNTTNSYTDTGLTNGTTYYYVVRAYDGVNESASSTEASAVPSNDPPFAPTGISAADRTGDDGGAINLSWTVSTSSDVTEQRVYRSTISGSGYTLITTINNNTTNSYTDTGLNNGAVYYYIVRAFDGTYESGNSNEANATPVDNTMPSAPTGLSATNTGQGKSVNLSWTKSTSGDVKEQRIYRSTTTGGPYTLVAKISNNTTTSYTDTGLTNGTTYYYVVRAYDGTNESGNSNEASATPSDTTAPVAPINLSASDKPGDKGGNIVLTWTPSTSTDVIEQRIYRSTTSGGSYSFVATISDNTTSTYTDSGLVNGTTYYYVIRAYDGTYESPNSNEASAKPLDDSLSVVAYFDVSGTKLTVTVTYSNVTDVENDGGDTYIQYTSTGSSLPSGYLHGTPIAYFDISQQRVTYSGRVTICVKYGVNQFFGVGYGGEKGARLLHYESGAFHDRTTTLNVNDMTVLGITYGGEVCGDVLSFSEFVVAVEEATLVTLTSFRATGMDGKVLLTWATAAEIDSMGFNILRGPSINGPFNRINDWLIRSKGTPTRGMTYTYEDIDVENGDTYFYKLENVDINGGIAAHMIASATPAAPPAPEAEKGTDLKSVPTTKPVAQKPAETMPPVVVIEQPSVPAEPPAEVTTEETLPQKVSKEATEERLLNIPSETVKHALKEKKRVGDEYPTSKDFALRIEDDEGNEISVRQIGDVIPKDPFETTVDEDGKITLKWSAKGALKGFDILRGDSSGKEFVKANTIPIPFFASQADEKGLLYTFKDGVTAKEGLYKYKIVTIMPDGTLRESRIVEVSTEPEKRPEKPDAKPVQKGIPPEKQ